MRAIQFSGPNAVDLVSLTPEPLRAGDARVRVLGAGICATDLEIYAGDMVYFTRGMASFPVVPGHEWVGEVLEINGTSIDISVGDHVVGEVSLGCTQCGDCKAGQYHRCMNRTETGILNRPGCFAETIDSPLHYLHKIDKTVPIASAALVEPTAVAFNGVLAGEVSPQDNVVIFGDGPIGLLLLQVSQAFGAQSVCLVGASDHRLEKARELGADLVIDARDKRVIKQISEFGNGVLPSVVLEATGNPVAAYDALHSARPGGRVIFQGLFAGQPLSGFDLDQVVINDLTVRGALSSPNIWPDVVTLIESGKVKPEAIVSHTVTLDEFESGLNIAMDGSGIKVLVKPN